MKPAHQYEVSAWWTSGKAGIARSEQATTAIHFTAPVSFGGIPGRWTPEELLLASMASCFVATFESISRYHNLPYTDLEVSVDAEVEKSGSGFQFATIGIKPQLTIPDEELRPLAERLLLKGETLCLVSRAVSTPKTFSPQVRVGVSLHHIAQGHEWSKM